MSMRTLPSQLISAICQDHLAKLESPVMIGGKIQSGLKDSQNNVKHGYIVEMILANTGRTWSSEGALTLISQRSTHNFTLGRLKGS